MKIHTISIIMGVSILFVGCGKKSGSSETVSTPVVITNPVVDTNSIWARQRHADEQASTNGDAQASLRVCVGNLRQIDAATDMWALEHKMQKGDIPTETDLTEYLPPGQSFPICPSGGTYTIAAVGETPVCSVSSHAIPNSR